MILIILPTFFRIVVFLLHQERVNESSAALDEAVENRGVELDSSANTMSLESVTSSALMMEDLSIVCGIEESLRNGAQDYEPPPSSTASSSSCSDCMDAEEETAPWVAPKQRVRTKRGRALNPFHARRYHTIV